MLTIIHGDNQIKSREKLLQLVQAKKAQGVEIVTKDAKDLTPEKLEEVLGTQNLFGQDRLVVIEALHSLPTSKKKKALVKHLTEATQDPTTPEVILWEKRLLTKTMLKNFPHATVFSFKVSQKLWRFLDDLGNPQISIAKQLTSLDEVVSQEDVHFVFLMIVRQIRLLIQAKEGHVSGAPFMIAKLKKQASYFSLNKLLQAHSKLFQIEKSFKTSTNLLDLKSTLDLFLISLYK